MTNLTAHANVWETCVQILQRRGMVLWVESEDDGYLWHARFGVFSFSASNPIELLGLVAIYDALSPEDAVPYWWSRATIFQRGASSEVERLLAQVENDS